MKEFLLNEAYLREQIEHIIKSKNWYSLTTGIGFSWEKSIKKMAEVISKEIGHIEPQQIKEIIENSFDLNALSKIGEKYFVDCLLEIDQELILWSEGDLAWQKTKLEKTGLNNKLNLKSASISNEKTTKLQSIISSITKEIGEKIQVVVIDDKEKNLTHAANLQNQIINNKVTINTFHLKLLDPEANPAACLKFISKIKATNIKIIVDMDGVLIDTDRVLSETVSQKLATFLCNR